MVYQTYRPASLDAEHVEEADNPTPPPIQHQAERKQEEYVVRFLVSVMSAPPTLCCSRFAFSHATFICITNQKHPLLDLSTSRQEVSWLLQQRAENHQHIFRRTGTYF